MERSERILHHISSASALKESEVKYYYIHWKTGGFMYLPVLPVLRTIMQVSRRAVRHLETFI